MHMECDKCHALFWKEELVPPSNPREQPNFSHCCKKGDISLTPFTNPPQLLHDLYVEGGIGQAVEEAVGQAVEEAVRQAVDSKTSS